MMLGEMAELVHSSIHTARRRLKEWRAHTSYNQNGCYYALPDVPEFDADRLWHWRGVFFSRNGSLKQTVVELIRRSSAGLDAGEMSSLLGLDLCFFLYLPTIHKSSERRRKDYPQNPAAEKMIAQIDKYWEKLFADPIAVETPAGPILVQPQRTNNILEQFFRSLKRANRRRTGNASSIRMLRTILAQPPLVRNLENPS